MNEQRQTAIMNTNQLIDYIKPISKNKYWKVLAKDPRFPKPIMGGNGAKALHSKEQVDRYLEEVARTGFLAANDDSARANQSAPTTKPKP